jgi:hypothetical protein
LRDFAGHRSGLSLCVGTSFGQDRHNLRAGLQRAPDSHGLLNALYLFVCSPVDLIEVLAKAVQKPADFFRNAGHGEKLVRRVDVLTGGAGAPATEPVDKVPGLVRRHTTRQAAQLLSAVNQLGALCVLCIGRAVKALRIGQWPRAADDRRRKLADRYTR